jgi:drug/metabolite transporter (DMT)-like permease
LNFLAGYTFALLASVLWGFNGILVRKALEKVDSFTGTFYIVFISGIFLLSLSTISGDVLTVEMDLRKVLLLSLGGIFQYFFGRTLTYFSVGVVGSSRAFTGTSTRIMFSAILGVVLLSERMGIVSLAGILVMIAGLYILSSERIRREGLLISILGGLSYGIASIFIKSGMLSSPALSNTISVFSAIPLIFVLAVKKGEGWKLNRFLLLSGFTMFLGTYCYYVSLSMIPVVIAVPVSNLYPVFTTLFSYFLIQKLENITIRAFLGSLIAVFGGILIYFG